MSNLTMTEVAELINQIGGEKEVREFLQGKTIIAKAPSWVLECNGEKLEIVAIKSGKWWKRGEHALPYMSYWNLTLIKEKLQEWGFKLPPVAAAQALANNPSFVEFVKQENSKYIKLYTVDGEDRWDFCWAFDKFYSDEVDCKGIACNFELGHYFLVLR